MAEENTDDNVQELSGTEKSAILMMLLGEDEASEILKNLTPKEVQHLGSAMYSVEGLDQDTVNKVLDEFLAIIKEQTSLGLGACLLYTSPSPRDMRRSRMPSSA